MLCLVPTRRRPRHERQEETLRHKTVPDMESLTKAELQLVYNLYGSARQFIANGEEAMPFMFLCKLPTEQQNGKLTPIQIKMPNTDEGKDELAAKLRQTVKKAKPDIVVFLGFLAIGIGGQRKGVKVIAPLLGTEILTLEQWVEQTAGRLQLA